MKRRDNVVGELTYRDAWERRESIRMFGRVYRITLAFDGEPDESLAESQRQAYASFADDRDQTIQRAEIALLEYYTTTVDDVRLRLGESAASLAPPILAVTGLSRVLKPTHLYFPLDFPEDGRIMGVLLDATWDPGHGVGVKLINEAVVEIGTQDIIL